MEFQMNWIPINSCDFFIWHSISRDSESVQFERHSNCRHVNLAEGTCSSGLTCLFWNSKCLSKCLDFLFAVESLWRTTGFWVYKQSRGTKFIWIWFFGIGRFYLMAVNSWQSAKVKSGHFHFKGWSETTCWELIYAPTIQLFHSCFFDQ